MLIENRPVSRALPWDLPMFRGYKEEKSPANNKEKEWPERKA